MIIYWTGNKDKINHDFSSWQEILFGVPQGSMLGPIWSNIFLSDLFLVIKETEFTSYADDKTLYDAGNNAFILTEILQRTFQMVFR